MLRFRLFGMLAFLGACTGPEIPEDLFTIQGAVSGVVRTAAQAPVAGASITFVSLEAGYDRALLSPARSGFPIRLAYSITF
jgi:hypothetical protein